MQKSSSDTFSVVSKQGSVAPTSLGAGCCWSWYRMEWDTPKEAPPGDWVREANSSWTWPPIQALRCGLLPNTVQMASAFAVTWKDWIGSFFSMFQFFMAHLFPLFSLTVHSNKILIKVISIYNFDCVLMKVFLLIIWGWVLLFCFGFFLVWYFSFVVKISNYQGSYNEIH